MALQITSSTAGIASAAPDIAADAADAASHQEAAPDTKAPRSGDPWSGLASKHALHEGVRNNADVSAGKQGAVLYSGQQAPGASNATAASARPATGDEVGKLYGALANGGTIGDLREGNLTRVEGIVHRWLSNGVRFEVRSGKESYFDSKTKTMVLGADASVAERARAVVFEERKMSHEAHIQGIKDRLGQRDYDNVNYRTNGHADPALKTRYEAKTREAFVEEKIRMVANAATEAIEFNRRERAAGRASTPAPLEDVYTAAYQATYAERYGKVLAESGSSHNFADNEARDYGSRAGRGAVETAIKNGQLRTADTHETWPQHFSRQWDAKEAVKAKEAAQLAKVQAAARLESERNGKIAAGAKALAEVVNTVDPKSPQAAQVIELVRAFTAQNPGAHTTLFAGDARAGLERLLGPFGFRTIEDVGNYKMEQARLDYALANFDRLTPPQRELVLKHPETGARFGISHMITYKELQAREQQFVNMRLPDGSNFQGSRAGYREASQRSIINHALGQLAQIRKAGPASLVGRIIGGEKGAAIGAMFDTFMPMATMRQQRNDMQNTVNSNRPDTRPTAVDSRPPPTRSPASETQPNRTGGATTGKSGTDTSGKQVGSTDRGYWANTKPDTANPMAGRDGVQRPVTDIGAARNAKKPAAGPDTPPAGGAAGKNGPVVANDNEAIKAQKIAVGDTTGTDARSIKASGPKKPDTPAQGGPVGEPKILKDPSPARTTQAEQATAKPAASKAAGAAENAASGSRYGNWSAGELMTGTPYKPTQRDLYRKTVENMADAMKAGTFDWAKANLTPIRIDENGKVLQGHHRLAAARLAKVPIPEGAIQRVPADNIREPRPWTQVTMRQGEKP